MECATLLAAIPHPQGTNGFRFLILHHAVPKKRVYLSIAIPGDLKIVNLS